jgi:WD40 repeat protein
MEMKSHLVPITALALHASKVYTGSKDMTVRGWRMGKRGICPDPQKHALSGHTGEVTCFGSVATLLLSGSADRTIIVWEGHSQMAQQIFESQIRKIVWCEDSHQIAVCEANSTVSILSATALLKRGKLAINRRIEGVTVSPLKILQEIDDSFLQLVGSEEMEVAELNLGKVIAKVHPNLGPILAIRSVRSVTLLAVAGRGLFMLNF